MTGPNPVDRGKSGSKIHVLTDRVGLPLALAVSGANLHDSQAFEPLLQGIPRIRSRRGPRRRKPAKVHADKAYDIPATHQALRERGIVDRIARIGVESSKRLGRHRWVVERTIAWLGGYRRLTVRYERHGHLFAAFLALAAALTCYKKLARLRLAFDEVAHDPAGKPENHPEQAHAEKRYHPISEILEGKTN